MRLDIKNGKHSARGSGPAILGVINFSSSHSKCFPPLRDLEEQLQI